MHLLRQPIHLPAGVTEDDSLRDGDRLVQIAQSIQLPLLLFDRDVELLDTFQGQFVPLDENPNGLSHELLGHLEHVCGHGCREKDNLSVLREELENLIDLVFETARQHLIGFIKAEDFDVVGPEGPAVDHIEDTSGSANDDLNTLLQLCHVLTDVGSANTGVTFNVHIVTKGNDDLLDLLSELTGWCEDESLGAFDREVELLKDGDGEGRSLASAGLCLSDDIVTPDDGDNCTLLDGGGTFEPRGEKASKIIVSATWPSAPVSVDATEEFRLQIHVVEAVGTGSVSDIQGRAKGVKHGLIDNFIPVGLNFAVWDILKRFSVASGSTSRRVMREMAGSYWVDMVVCG